MSSSRMRSRRLEALPCPTRNKHGKETNPNRSAHQRCCFPKEDHSGGKMIQKAEPEPLTTEQLTQLESFIAEASLSIELQDEDLVLIVDYQVPDDEDGFDAHSKVTARVNPQTVIGYSVGCLVDNSTDPELTRVDLFAMAGRLSEAANFVGTQAASLNEYEGEIPTRVVPRLFLDGVATDEEMQDA